MLKMAGSSMLMVLLTCVLTLGTGAEAQAQGMPLTVTNTTPCPIWVQGQNGTGINVGCTTAWTMVPPGAIVSIPTCGGPSSSWYHVHYTFCPTPTAGCPIGTTNSSVASCGMATVMIPNCMGTGMFTPTWGGVGGITAVTF